MPTPHTADGAYRSLSAAADATRPEVLQPLPPTPPTPFEEKTSSAFCELLHRNHSTGVAGFNTLPNRYLLIATSGSLNQQRTVKIQEELQAKPGSHPFDELDSSKKLEEDDDGGQDAGTPDMWLPGWEHWCTRIQLLLSH
nr:uncharacterized protein At1g04910-like [Ipomoea batatas]